MTHYEIYEQSIFDPLWRERCTSSICSLPFQWNFACLQTSRARNSFEGWFGFDPLIIISFNGNTLRKYWRKSEEILLREALAVVWCRPYLLITISMELRVGCQTFLPSKPSLASVPAHQPCLDCNSDKDKNKNTTTMKYRNTNIQIQIQSPH